MQTYPAAPLDLVAEFFRPVSNQKLFMVVHANERLNVCRLRSALQQMTKVMPLLGCRLNSDAGIPAWVYATNEHDCTLPPLNERDGSFEHSTHLKRDRHDRYALTIDIHHEENGDTVCIAADHALTDAAGLKTLGYMLTAAYRHKSMMLVPKNIEMLSRSRDFAEISRNLNKWEKLRVVSCWRVPARRWLIPCVDWHDSSSRPESKSVYAIRHLRRKTVSALKNRLRLHQATLNDALIAAYFRSILDLRNTDSAVHRPIQFTVDLRRFLPPERRAHIANMSGADHVWLNYAPTDSFGRTIEQTAAAMAKIKQRHPGLASALLLNSLISSGYHLTMRFFSKVVNPGNAATASTPVLANFGIIDKNRLRFGATVPVQAFIAGPDLLLPGLITGVSSCNDALTLSIGFNSAITDIGFVNRLLDTMADYLENLLFLD